MTLDTPNANRLTRVKITQAGEEPYIVKLTAKQIDLLESLIEVGGVGLPVSDALISLMLRVPARVVERPDPNRPPGPGSDGGRRNVVQMLPYVSYRILPDLPEVEPEPKIDLGSDWKITAPGGATATLRTFGAASEVLTALSASGADGFLTGPENAPLQALLLRLQTDLGVRIDRHKLDDREFWVLGKPLAEVLKLRELLDRP